MKNASSDPRLPSIIRNSVSSILIIHPVAAFLILICLCLSASAHLDASFHSPHFILAQLMLLLVALLVTLVTFLVDVLLFVPYLQWGGWIVLVATIILVSCAALSCAMRRAIVSREIREQQTIQAR